MLVFIFGYIVLKSKEQPFGMFGWFSKGEGDTLIKWEKVKTVGDDVILVDLG